MGGAAAIRGLPLPAASRCKALRPARMWWRPQEGKGRNSMLERREWVHAAWRGREAGAVRSPRGGLGRLLVGGGFQGGSA